MKDSFSGTGETIALILCALNTIVVVAFLVKIWAGDWIAARTRR